MALLKKILGKLNGLHYTQEYLCLPIGSHTAPLSVYLLMNGKIFRDITRQHLFIGYHPLVFAINFPPENVSPEVLQIIFSNHSLALNVSYNKKDALASLELLKIREQPEAEGSFCFYKGVEGSYSFISLFHQFINRLYNKWYNQQPGNVFLHHNLYLQVQIAYAIPRIISLISVSLEEKFNLFPTDLHGQVNEKQYIISLRTNGKACKQVEKAGKIVLSRVDAGFYKTVYALGKNHMQEVNAKENFPFSLLRSENYMLPLPTKTLSYMELELKSSFMEGIHKILLFNILHYHVLQDEASALCHIHNSYATWRYKNKLPGNYLLR